MGVLVGLGSKKKETKKDESKAKIAELEKKIKTMKESEAALIKENEELKAKIAELETPKN